MAETELALMTYQEVDALDRSKTVVALPVGSMEQHGPHLPIDTDTYLCTRITYEAAARALTGGPVVVTPSVWLGVSEHHMAFSGTLTSTRSTLRQTVGDLSRSLARHGLNRQIVVNGHGGNVSLLADLIHELGFEGDLQLGTVNYFALASEVVSEIRESPSGGMGHSGEFETSLMLFLRPESVRTDLVKRELAQPRYPAEHLDMFEPSRLIAHWTTDELSESGVMGAPDLATAEKGQRIFEACVTELADIIESLR